METSRLSNENSYMLTTSTRSFPERACAVVMTRSGKDRDLIFYQDFHYFCGIRETLAIKWK
jgi:hypothetical protein